MKRARTLVLAILSLLLALTTTSAYAATVRWYDGDTTIYPYLYHYDADRYVAYNPYGIAILKYDGPSMYWETHDCSGNSNGFWVGVPNSDPAPWVWLKPNNSSPTYLMFCLAIQNTSGSSTDSFDALMEWDGY